MNRSRPSLLLAALMSLVFAPGASAQGLHISAAGGAFIPASDFDGVREGAEQARLDRSSTLGLGLNLEAGWFRGSLAYASGVTLNDRSAEGRIGDGSVLAVAADLLLRPIPGSPIQPYGLAGVGVKRQNFSFRDEGVGTNPFPSDARDLGVHLGVGADLMLGGIGLMVEATDFITRTSGGDWGQHDVFLVVGLRFRLGGGERGNDGSP
jgi:hypothetical protein